MGGVKTCIPNKIFIAHLLDPQNGTLRMFTHAIGLACANSWTEFKKEAASLGIAQKICWIL